jgi:SAM-dependent methyltransferase
METDSEHISVIDPQSGADMVRLIDRHQLVTRCMGGLFPQDIDTSEIQYVLDLACGPGGWVQDVAFEHQDMAVIGVDSRPAMLAYARTLARVQGLDNASFQVMDMLGPLDFFENSFDFIQGCFLCSALPVAAWPGLLHECVRILRPGGIIRLIEAAWPDTNSPAVQRLGTIVAQALHQVGRTCSPDGQTPFATAMLVPFLRDAGVRQVRSQTYEVPFTTGTFGAHPIMKLARITLYLLEPFLRDQGVTSHEEFEALIRQMDWETIGESFRGKLCFADAWGEKAGECDRSQGHGGMASI